MIADKNFYNASSAAKLGWSPDWFGCVRFDEYLEAQIEEFQKKNNISPVDGCCGPVTFKVALKERKFNSPVVKDGIFYNGQEYEFNFFKFVGLKNPKALVASPEHYRNVWEPKKLIVVHHDACLCSHDCYTVLERRGLSVQFLIDYDGTIYQSVDCGKHAQHVSLQNKFSIGIEVCNPIEVKYN